MKSESKVETNGKVNIAVEEIKKKYSEERKLWMYGILIWLICFEALAVMALFSKTFRWVLVTIGFIVVVLVAKMYSNAMEGKKHD